METIDEIEEFEKDLVSLARLASQGAEEDVRLLLAKLVRKYRMARPALASQLDLMLKASRTRSHGPAVLRRGVAMPESSNMLVLTDALIRAPFVLVAPWYFVIMVSMSLSLG